MRSEGSKSRAAVWPARDPRITSEVAGGLQTLQGDCLACRMASSGKTNGRPAFQLQRCSERPGEQLPLLRVRVPNAQPGGTMNPPHVQGTQRRKVIMKEGF